MFDTALVWAEQCPLSEVQGTGYSEVVREPPVLLMNQDAELVKAGSIRTLAILYVINENLHETEIFLKPLWKDKRWCYALPDFLFGNTIQFQLWVFFVELADVFRMHLHQRVQFIIHHNIGATNVVINAFFFRCFELFCVFVKFALDPIDYLEMIVVICVYIILYDS